MSRNDSDHYVYPPTGERLTRVSAVLDATDGKQRYLVPWSARLAAERAVDDIETLLKILQTEGRQAAVDYAKAGAAEQRDLKAGVGTYVHDVVESLILWQASPDGRGSDLVLPLLPEHLQGLDYDEDPVEDVAEWMVDGFLNWSAAWKPQFEAAEMTVFNHGLGVAGTLDMIAYFPHLAISPAGRFMPGSGVRVCVDVKTGRNSGVTWREQIAAYRQMTECLLPMGDLHPMPATDCGAVLHLRPEHADGYRFMPIAGAKHAAAWNRFRRAIELHQGRSAERAKPGPVCYPPRPDGTVPQPRLADLDDEGYGRALAPLIKAGIGDLEQLAAMREGDCRAIKGVGPKIVEVIRQMLADHGLHLRDEAPVQLGAVALCRSSTCSAAASKSAGSASASRSPSSRTAATPARRARPGWTRSGSRPARGSPPTLSPGCTAAPSASGVASGRSSPASPRSA